MFYKALLKKKRNKKAFTLIELIVVIAIIGVLVAILVPTLSGFVGSATQKTALANARTVYSVAQAQLQFALSSSTAGVTTSLYPNSPASGFMTAVVPQVPVGSGESYTVHVTVTNSSYAVDSVVYTLKDGTKGTYPQ